MLSELDDLEEIACRINSNLSGTSWCIGRLGRERERERERDRETERQRERWLLYFTIRGL